ncbi:transmembrane protein [Ceratobasidium sp. AG-Ba]|nr:transmembrane protein [Ceratobasidium sp. AG-Ba]
MPLPNIPIDTIATALGFVALTILLPAGLAQLRRWRSAPNSTPDQPGAKPQPKKTSSAIRTTVTLYSILALAYWYYSQPDLFTRLRLPLTATGDQIRSALVTQRPKEFIPVQLQAAYDHGSTHGLNVRSKEPKTSHPLFTPQLDRVLQRIETFDVRIVYSRLGHAVVESCEWCTAPEDYLVFGAAGLGLAYVVLAVVVGLVTEAPERRKSRVWAVAGIALAAAADVFCTGFVKGTLRRGENIPASFGPFS